MDRRKVLLAGGAALTTALAGCSESDSTDRETGDSDTNNSEGGDNSSDNSSDSGESQGDEETLVELLDHEWYSEDEFNAGVKGQVENVSGEQLSYVEVAVYFLDSDGVQFAEGMANTTELAAERVWEFDAMFMGDDPSRVDNYEIETSVDNY